MFTRPLFCPEESGFKQVTKDKLDRQIKRREVAAQRTKNDGYRIPFDKVTEWSIGSRIAAKSSGLLWNPLRQHCKCYNLTSGTILEPC